MNSTVSLYLYLPQHNFNSIHWNLSDRMAKGHDPLGKGRDPLSLYVPSKARRYCQYFRFIECFTYYGMQKGAWWREIRVVGRETVSSWYSTATGIHPGLVNYAWNYEKGGHGCPGHTGSRNLGWPFIPKYQPAASPFDIGLYTVSGISMTDKRVWRASGCAIKRKSNDPRGICRICAPV